MATNVESREPEFGLICCLIWSETSFFLTKKRYPWTLKLSLDMMRARIS